MATEKPSSAALSNGLKKKTGASAKPSPHRGIRSTRGNTSASVSDLFASNGSDFDQHSSSSKRTVAKAPDRSQIQEELKSVLASTIDLTKVLQDQLHELKLKGWNFAARATAPSAQ